MDVLALGRIRDLLEREASSAEVLPSCVPGKAAAYTDARWPLFERHAGESNDEVDIDNSRCENAIRPTAAQGAN